LLEEFECEERILVNPLTDGEFKLVKRAWGQQGERSD
jgi:hypothetical protein